ncbi:MAG: SDR family NAD(P)-dependent oxidoreductase [Planctomycetes bacterium]|nr:SDR family NAD(P)-dependent oxidoreductase [Planctomycetota bacterium]
MSKLLEGKVAVITGAGGGLGRCHALAFAAEGAKVVVNDLGGARDGTGAGRKAADLVVEEITKAGGQAAANYDSVATTEGAENLIRTALEKFGRIDILVNNAGILRDKTILKMSDEEFDLVMAVHARGTWACTRAAARAMTEKGIKGRIVNTTSAAGLKGNFGQSNYSAAKAAIYGLTITSALEFGKFGITVNAVAPLAKTRMTEDIDMVSAEMRPEDVSPLVVFLAADLAQDVTGRIFGVHGTHIFEYKMEVTDGVKKDTSWKPSEIAERLGEIAGARKAAAPAAVAAPSGDPIRQFFQLLPSGMDPERAKEWKSVMHWAVTGAGDWTVEVAEKKAKVADGKPGAPTCTITVDAETMRGMIEGKVDPQMAFLGGKIKATRLDDLGKFGKVFDFKKMKALAASAAPAAAAAPASGTDRIRQLFQLLPNAFDAERAKDWKTVMHFSVTGGGDFTVEVADKKAKAAEGKPAAPTCTVTVDAETLTGMIDGKVDPQMAFLGGKIKATRLDDLGKFGKVFDFKKLRGAAPAAVAAPVGAALSAAPAPKSAPDPRGLLQTLPYRFLPEKAAGFNGVLQFQVDGADAWVEIRDQKCAAKAGKHPSPTGTVTIDASTLAGVLDGAIDPSKAQIKVTHPPAWLKFRQCFTFEPLKGLNRALIGRTYLSPAQLIRPEHLTAYDEVIGDKGCLVFPVTLIKDLFMKFLQDPEFNGDIARMVHGGQTMIYHKPWKAWDIVSPRGNVLSIEDKSSGQLLTLGQKIYSEGELLVELQTALFFRGESKGEKAAAPPAPDRGKPTASNTIVVPDDLPLRYAKVSGDDNPIHVDSEFAKSVGFKNVILHGLATLGLSMRFLPKTVERLQVRFSKPVYPGDRLTVNVWEKDRTLLFETVNQDGERVLTEGSATLKA